MISTLKQLGVGSSQALFAWLPASENVNQAPKSKKRKREERRSSAQAELEGHNDEAFSQNEHDLAHVGNGHADDATLAQPKKKKKRKNMLEGERESIQSVVEKPRWEEGFGDDAGHEDGARSRQKKKRKSRNHPQEDQQGSIHPITAQVSNTGETAGEDVVKDSQFEMEDQAITKSKKRKKPRKSTTVEDTSIHDPITGYDLHGESSQLDSRAEDTLATSKKKKSRKNKFADEDSIAETEGLEVLSNRMPEGEYDNEEASVKSKKSHRSGNNIVREGSVTRHLQDLDSTHGNVQVTATPPKPKEKAGGARRDEEDLAALEPVLDSEAIFTSTLNDALGKRQPAPLKAPALTKKQKKRARKDRELSRNENLLSVGKTNTSHAEDIDEVRHYSVPGMLPPAMSSSTPVGSSMTKATTLRKPKAKTPIMMPKISSSQSSLAPNRPPKKPVEQPRNAFSTPNTSQRNRPSKQSSNATPSSARTPKAPANELSFAVVYPSETPQDSVRPVSTPGNAGKTPVADLEAIDRVVEIFRESHGMTQFDMNALIWQPQKEVNELQKEFWNIFPETVPHLMDTKRLRRTVRSRHHNFNKGPWSVEEDEELRNLYGSFPNQWVKLSGLINRPPNAIKTRWKQVLINGDNLIGLRGMVRWTLAEEMKLRDAVADCIKHIQELRRSNKEFAKKAQGQSDEELIHWQTVSDKMGRTRSFPKCIAKWKQLQARAAEEGDNLNEYTPSSRSGKRYVEDAKRIARDLQAPEILQMLYAIRVTEAGSESKIPWDRVMGAIQFSTGRGIRSLAHSTCFRKLREKVPGSEDMRLREVLDVLIDAFETSEPEIPDQLRDHEYIRPVERKVKRQSLRKKRRASSKYVQDDYSIGQSPNPNGEISLQAGDDTEINNPVDVQEVADEEAPSEQRRRKKQKSDVVPEGNEETPQLSQKKKKRNSKAVGDEGLNGDSAGGVDHQGPAETTERVNVPGRRVNLITSQRPEPETNSDEIAPYLNETVAKALQTIMDSPRIDPRLKRRMRHDLLAALHEDGIKPLASQDEASNKSVEAVNLQSSNSDDQPWLLGRRGGSEGYEATNKVNNDEWNVIEDDEDSTIGHAYTELAEESPSKSAHISQEGRNEGVARNLTLAIDSLLPDATSPTSESPSYIAKSTTAIALSSQNGSRDTLSPVLGDTQLPIDMGEAEMAVDDTDDDLILASTPNDITDKTMDGHETLAGHVLEGIAGLDSSHIELRLGNDGLEETVNSEPSRKDLFNLEIPNSQILQVVIPVHNQSEINVSSSCGGNGEMPHGQKIEEQMLLDITESQADLMIVDADHEQRDIITRGNNCALSKQHITESDFINISDLETSNRCSPPARKPDLPTNPQTANGNDRHSTGSSSVIESAYEQDSDIDDVDVGPAVLRGEKHGDNPLTPPTRPQLESRAKSLNATSSISPSLSEQKSEQESEQGPEQSEQEFKHEFTGLDQNDNSEGGSSPLFGDEHDLEIGISREQGHLQQLPRIESTAITRTETKDSTMVMMVKALLPFGRRTVDTHYQTSTESSVTGHFVDALETQELDSQTDVEMGYEAEDEDREERHGAELAHSIRGGSEGSLSSRSPIEVWSPKVASSPHQNPISEVVQPVSEPKRHNLRTRNKAVNYSIAHYFDTHKGCESTPQAKQADQLVPTDRLAPIPKPSRQARGVARPKTKRKNNVVVDSSDDDIPAEVLRSPQPVVEESDSDYGWGPCFPLPAKFSKAALRK